MRSFAMTRAGHTLVEVAATLAVAAVLLAAIGPAGRRALDANTVRAARDDVDATLEDARRRAQWRGQRVDVRFDTTTATLRMIGGGDTILTRPLGAVLAVRLSADRSNIAYAPSGLGFGVANARLILSRGASADTLWISRLGRVRR